MREARIRILTFVLALLLAGTAGAGGGVWISDKGEAHEIGSNAIFFDEDGESFDLSDLEDGEVKVFGRGDKQITASRVGETIVIDRPKSNDERAIRIECEVGQDSCKVMTFGEHDEKVALMIQKRHAGQQIMTIDEDVMLGEDGEATIMITQVGDCEHDSDADCVGKRIEILEGGDVSGEMVVEVLTSTGHGHHAKNVWVSAEGPHVGHHTMIVGDGATPHDLDELYDGETRIFGYGDRQVTAVREGDKVTISRPQSDKENDVLVTCKIGRDTCKVLTYDDDPEKVAVMIAKTAGCDDGEDCAELLRLHMQDGHEGDYEVIELRDGGSGEIYLADPDKDKHTIRRIKVVREEDD